VTDAIGAGPVLRPLGPVVNGTYYRERTCGPSI